MRQLEQNSSIPNSRLGVFAKGAFVSTAESRKDEPNSGLINDPCLPSSPNPHSKAGGIINNFPAIGPVTASAGHPCCSNHEVTFLAAAAARPYWRTTSKPARNSGAYFISSYSC